MCLKISVTPKKNKVYLILFKYFSDLKTQTLIFAEKLEQEK